VQQAQLLNFDLEENNLSQYKGNANLAYSTIRSFSEEKKGWYSILMGTVLLVNKKPTEKELSLVSRILDQSGISKEEFNNTNIKAQVFMKNLKF